MVTKERFKKLGINHFSMADLESKLQQLAGELENQLRGIDQTVSASTKTTESGIGVVINSEQLRNKLGELYPPESMGGLFNLAFSPIGNKLLFGAYVLICYPSIETDVLTSSKYKQLHDNLISITDGCIFSEKGAPDERSGRRLTIIRFGGIRLCRLPEDVDHRTILDEYIFSEVGLIKAALTYLNNF